MKNKITIEIELPFGGKVAQMTILDTTGVLRMSKVNLEKQVQSFLDRAMKDMARVIMEEGCYKIAKGK